ncbi:hypothetical protein RJT34_03667 [Clitoria ternatea]|uniref:Uncharacterized protein n=1 Tax=Clitoria ternatea TaxID=43366 RepID=A0AAN9KML8_CLITE
MQLPMTTLSLRLRASGIRGTLEYGFSSLHSPLNHNYFSIFSRKFNFPGKSRRSCSHSLLLTPIPESKEKRCRRRFWYWKSWKK